MVSVHMFCYILLRFLNDVVLHPARAFGEAFRLLEIGQVELRKAPVEALHRWLQRPLLPQQPTAGPAHKTSQQPLEEHLVASG